MRTELQQIEHGYEDRPEAHQELFEQFTNEVNRLPHLKTHRDYIENNDYGYGDRAYHYLWDLLVRSSPKGFKALEIGVFQGQTLSLIALLSKEYGKDGIVSGITPLTGAGDSYKKHAEIDYKSRIQSLFKLFGVNAQLIQGMSYDPRVQRIAEEDGPYDLIYIDGCHDYDVVVDDINVYSRLLYIGGYLVIDDCGNSLNLPDGLNKDNFKGLPEVSKAVEDTLAGHLDFKHVFSVGHNRVFRKTN